MGIDLAAMAFGEQPPTIIPSGILGSAMLAGDGVVILSEFTLADVSVMSLADADPELRRRFDFPEHFVPSLEHSEEVVRRWQRERLAGERYPHAVRAAATLQLLGGCELRPLGQGLANVSYWTYPSHRSRGVASRALALLIRIASDDHGFTSLEAAIDPDNVASRAVAERNGFSLAAQRDGRDVFVRRLP
jgi:RimJ/RimL family protein N-acetyltransferase